MIAPSTSIFRRRGLSMLMTLVAFLSAAVWTGPVHSAERSSTSLNSEFPLDAVLLYTVKDGKVNRRIFDGRLIENQPLEIDGYVSGIVVLSRDRMTVTLEDRQMNKLQKRSDGVYVAEHFGALDYSDLAGGVKDNPYFPDADGEDSKKKRHDHLSKEGYSLFPKVIGDALWTGQSFRVRFKSGGESLELKVKQSGFESTDMESAGSKPFVYLGNRLDELKDEIPDFQHRIDMVISGIDQVEDMVGRSLIDRIVLVDYEGVENAVTCKDTNDIWIYINTFQTESADELQTIAAHETLHEYVDLRDFTKRGSLRRLFADLMGYSALSFERFLVVSQGIVPKKQSRSGTDSKRFFEFINEKNFLENRKGGHADENLDEFATSFIHSLLHIDRLKAKINENPVSSKGATVKLNDEAEKNQIVASYFKAAETFADIVRKSDSTKKEQAFFQRCLLRCEEVASDGAAIAYLERE